MVEANQGGVFWVILIANTMTLLITITSAIRKPTWSYRVIAVLGISAFTLALHQLVTGRLNPLTLLFTALLVLILWFRVMMNSRDLKGKGKL